MSTLTSREAARLATKLGAPGTLMNGAQYDAQRRFDILSEEINHFLRYLRFRIGPTTEFDQLKYPLRRPYDSQQAFLVRLGKAGQALNIECDADRNEAEAIYEKLKSLWIEAAGRSEPHRQQEQSELVRRQTLWIAKSVGKASLIAARLGELHDRLQQFLQRTNPDHPEPTLRRRLEHGLADKYLSELVRWIHKDIAEFCSTKYAGEYPSSCVPSTFQFWGYSHTSSHHSFVTFDEHNRDRSGERSSESIDEQRFTSVAVSYWIPERPALAPLIGHEVARQVLKTIYGRHTQISTLEQDMTPLGAVYRALNRCADEWLADSIKNKQIPASVPLHLATEILSDALGALRFGWAYVHAQALQMMSDERFATLFEDSTGMLRRAHAKPTKRPKPVNCPSCKLLKRANQTCSFCQDFDRFSKDAEVMSARLKAFQPITYYRGKVLLSLMDAVFPIAKNDMFALGLRHSYEFTLEAYLSLFTNNEEDRKEYERQFAKALGESLCTSALSTPNIFIVKARHFVARSMDRSTGLLQFENTALARQALSPSFREFLKRRLDPWLRKPRPGDDSDYATSVQAFDVENCPGLVDVVWRIEWLVAAHHKESTEPEILKSAKLLRRLTREVLAVGIDDYLFRTGGPRMLLSTLNEGHPTNDFARLLRDHNKLSNMGEAYSLDVLTALDAHLRSKRDKDFEFTFRGKEFKKEIQVVVASDRLNWLPDLVVDTNWHERWLERPSENKVRESIVMLDLLCIKSEITSSRGTKLEEVQNKLSGTLQIEAGNTSVYKDFHSGTLLGRYDAFVFYTQQTRSGEHPSDDDSSDWVIKFGKTVHPNIRTTYVSRTKRLVRVWGDKKAREAAEQKESFGRATSVSATDSMDATSTTGVRSTASQPSNSTWPLMENTCTLGIILVSLKWDASRTIVARWLVDHIAKEQYGLDFAVFLSDGWEDLVVVASVPNLFLPRLDRHHHRSLTGFVEKLNESPFVASTETLFSEMLLQKPPKDFSFRFAVRIGKPGYAKVLEKLAPLEKKYAKSHLRFEIRNVAGNRDIDILVGASTDVPSDLRASSSKRISKLSLKELHLDMRMHLSGYAKFETRVGWTKSEGTKARRRAKASVLSPTKRNRPLKGTPGRNSAVSNAERSAG